MVKLIIAGGRDYRDYPQMRVAITELQKVIGPIDSVVSGAARGADTVGARVAEEMGIHVQYVPADWDRYGRGAGFRRNEEMARIGTHVLAFWDGESRGTKHMIDMAEKWKLPKLVIDY